MGNRPCKIKWQVKAGFRTGSGVHCQISPFENHEVIIIVMPMLYKNASRAEKRVGVIFTGAGSHEYLAHVGEMPCSTHVWRWPLRFNFIVGK